MANAIWQATIVDQSGNVLPGAEVEVVDESTGLSAPLFSTRTGTTKSNPFFADANGFAQFYAAPGLYRITATSSGTGTTMTWRNVRLVDVATNAEAIAGTAGVLPDAEQVRSVIAQDVPPATTETAGRVEKATSQEAQDGTDDKFPDAAGVHAALNRFGLGADAYTPSNFDSLSPSGWYRGPDGGNSSGLTNSFWVGMHAKYGEGTGGTGRGLIVYIEGFTGSSASLRYAHAFDTPWSKKTLLDTGNTTVDGNGFIKAASPIVKLHSDRIEKNGDFSADFERIATGHYVIKNTLGFAQEGWYIETPKDANGNVKVFVEYADNDGDITVKTYEPDYSTGRAVAGEAVDIPTDRWVDIRLHELPTEPVDEESKE